MTRYPAGSSGTGLAIGLSLALLAVMLVVMGLVLVLDSMRR